MSRLQLSVRYPAEGGAPLRRLLTLGGMALACLCAVILYRPFFDPSRFWVGFDFIIYDLAAFLLRHGGNPYNPVEMVHAYVHVPHLAPVQAQEMAGGRPWVQAPWTSVLFLPALLLPPFVSLRLWWALSLVLLGGAVMLALRAWPVRNANLRAVLFLLSPPVVWGLFLGQIDALVLLLWVLTLWWLQRRRYTWMGLTLMLDLLKPQLIAGPALLLALVAWRRRALPSYLRGAALGVAGMLAVTLLVAGPANLLAWTRLLAGFSSHGLSSYDDLASLATLYIGWLPGVAHLLDVVCGCAWLALVLWLARRLRSAEDEQWWVLFGAAAWLLVTPYAHSHDVIVLLPALCWLHGRAGSATGRARRLAEGALWATWWLFPYLTAIGSTQALPVVRGLGIVPILLVVALLWQQRPGRRVARGRAAESLLKPAAA